LIAEENFKNLNPFTVYRIHTCVALLEWTIKEHQEITKLPLVSVST